MRKILIKFRNIIIATIATVPLGGRAFVNPLPAGNPFTFQEIDDIGLIILEFLYGVAMTLSVIFVVMSGIMMMIARGNPTKFAEAGQRLKTAVIGFAVVFGAGVIINTVAALLDRSFFW